jgi:hypothetical protein
MSVCLVILTIDFSSTIIMSIESIYKMIADGVSIVKMTVDKMTYGQKLKSNRSIKMPLSTV